MKQLAALNPNPNLDAIFSALADPTRRSILARLADGEACVNELREPFDISQPAITKHLQSIGAGGDWWSDTKINNVVRHV